MNLIPYLLMAPLAGLSLLVFYYIAAVLLFNVKEIRVVIPATKDD